MTKEEIKELLLLNDWQRTDLASRLRVSETAVYQWIIGRRKPGGPASVLMKQMLVKAKRHRV